ncbi:unnamed protein product, partial [Urochloa humidicola]
QSGIGKPSAGERRATTSSRGVAAGPSASIVGGDQLASSRRCFVQLRQAKGMEQERRVQVGGSLRKVGPLLGTA